jgi:hypothetical protein
MKRLFRESRRSNPFDSAGRSVSTTPQTVSKGVSEGGGVSEAHPFRSADITCSVLVPRLFTVDQAVTG